MKEIDGCEIQNLQILKKQEDISRYHKWKRKRTMRIKKNDTV